MKVFNIFSLFLSILNIAASNEKFCSSIDTSANGLVTPLIEQIKNWNIQRYKDFDDEDIDTYIEVIVFCFLNCSDLLWEKIVLVIDKNLRQKVRICKNFKITKTNSFKHGERSVKFLETEWFFNFFLEVSQV